MKISAFVDIFCCACLGTLPFCLFSLDYFRHFILRVSFWGSPVYVSYSYFLTVPFPLGLIPPAKRIKLKRKRENNLGPHRGASEEDETVLANMQDGDGPPMTNSDFCMDPPPEVFPNKGIRISDFPAAVKQKVGRPHSSIFALVAEEQSVFSSDPVDERPRVHSFFLENISHGQLQVLSRIPADCPALVPLDQEKPESSSFVCTPPSIAEGRGVLRWFKVPDQARELVHILPTHAGWYLFYV